MSNIHKLEDEQMREIEDVITKNSKMPEEIKLKLFVKDLISNHKFENVSVNEQYTKMNYLRKKYKIYKLS